MALKRIGVVVVALLFVRPVGCWLRFGMWVLIGWWLGGLL